MKKLTPEEVVAFEKERSTFIDYKNIEEYIEDVAVLLVYSPWRYTEELALQLIEDRKDYIEEAFRDKESAYSCSAEVGFVGG